MISSRSIRAAQLVLADGAVFTGEAIGAEPANGVASGEVVFNTVLSGYQEVISDPSYAGQIITFTYPHIGNYGVNSADDEASQPYCRGVVIRDLPRRHSNWRSHGDLDAFLRDHNLAGIAGVDTRRLTRHIRDAGAMPGAFGVSDRTTLHAVAVDEPATSSIDLVAEVSTKKPYTIAGPKRRVIAYDLGIKSTMLRHLSKLAAVTVVPAGTTAAEVLAASPDGIFLSNGPGDPQMVGPLVDELPKLLGHVPIFGICLGHQVLALALGGTTYKMKFGHHGGNVPVKDLRSGKVEITSQNHNFAVESGSVPDVVETHVCLNDNTLAGMRHRELPVFSVQYHPEAGPGPHDSRYLFEEFARLMDTTGSVH